MVKKKKNTKAKKNRFHDFIMFHKLCYISSQGFVFQRYYIFTWWSVLPPKKPGILVSKQKLQEPRSRKKEKEIKKNFGSANVWKINTDSRF